MPKLSPYTTAVASGSIRVAGALTDVDHLLVDGTVDTRRHATVRLRASATPRRSGSRSTSTWSASRICSSSARTRSSTSAARSRCTIERIALRASGDANLGILQGFFRDVRGSGRAAPGRRGRRSAVRAGVFRQRHDRRRPHPSFLAAEFARRHQRRRFTSTRAGPARRRDGDDGRRADAVRRPHRVRRLPAGRAERHRARRRHAPAVSGRRPVHGRCAICRSAATSRRRPSAACVTVKNAIWNRRIDPTGGLLDFGGGRSTGDGRRAGGGRRRRAAPLRRRGARALDAAHREQPGAARGQRRSAAARHLRSAAALRPRRGGSRRGDVRRPALSGHARHHRVHQPDAHRAVLRRRGRDARAGAGPDLPGDRPRRRHDGAAAAGAQLRSAAAGGRRAGAALQRHPPRPDGQDVELRALQNPNERQRDILTTRATQLLANPISSEVGRVVEQTFGVDTFPADARRSSIPTASRRTA